MVPQGLEAVGEPQDFQPAATQPGGKCRFLRPRSNSAAEAPQGPRLPILSCHRRCGTRAPSRAPPPSSATRRPPHPSPVTAVSRQSPLLGDFGGPTWIPALQSPSPSSPRGRAEPEPVLVAAAKRRQLRLRWLSPNNPLINSTR
ncbi:uncharacterized protein DKFZp434B061-like [Grus americana]|uniref:uncharacterized protein DKFZp434B061-like n=1 Tax=Grus americana TaxID=9117 RepID=UPI0024078162|nr:uncharacterized protein DKFZp434B061-like [Grus americana]